MADFDIQFEDNMNLPRPSYRVFIELFRDWVWNGAKNNYELRLKNQKLERIYCFMRSDEGAVKDYTFVGVREKKPNDNDFGDIVRLHCYQYMMGCNDTSLANAFTNFQINKDLNDVGNNLYPIVYYTCEAARSELMFQYLLTRMIAKDNIPLSEVGFLVNMSRHAFEKKRDRLGGHALWPIDYVDYYDYLKGKNDDNAKQDRDKLSALMVNLGRDAEIPRQPLG